jgi:molybdopterin-guanine dinucleotide biosynthesis protein A
MHCTGVILAGGRAERFDGAHKGLARVGGARILDRVVGALRASSDALLMVANDPAAADWLPGVHVVPDVEPGAGSLGGILTALTHAPEAALVVAWDMPFVDAGLLRCLRSLGEGGGDLAWPASDAPVGVEPLCAWYAPTCRPAIAAALARGDRRIAALHATLHARTLAVEEVRRFGDPERLFLNVNTPDDLARAQRLAAGE